MQTVSRFIPCGVATKTAAMKVHLGMSTMYTLSGLGWRQMPGHFGYVVLKCKAKIVSSSLRVASGILRKPRAVTNPGCVAPRTSPKAISGSPVEKLGFLII